MGARQASVGEEGWLPGPSFMFRAMEEGSRDRLLGFFCCEGFWEGIRMYCIWLFCSFFLEWGMSGEGLRLCDDHDLLPHGFAGRKFAL